MPVYVDRANIPFGNMIMYHMLADTLDELHEMADKIGVRRRWFQNRNIPHYDICKSKRVLAIQFGAIEIDNRQLLELIRKQRKGEK